MGNRECRRTSLILAILLMILPPAASADQPAMHPGDFSKLTPGDPLPTLWEPLTFKKIQRHTRYRLVAEGNLTVIADAPEPLDTIRRSSLGEVLGHERMFFNLQQAVEAYVAGQESIQD